MYLKKYTSHFYGMLHCQMRPPSHTHMDNIARKVKRGGWCYYVTVKTFLHHISVTAGFLTSFASVYTPCLKMGIPHCLQR